jgi:hypothetical protein
MSACSRVLREGLAAGVFIVTDGGWDREWHQWGIITRADADGTIVGMTPDRADPNRLDHDEHYWVVKAGETPRNPHEADLEMLRRAIHRIRGDREPFLPGRAVFGLHAMDTWVAQMRKPSFQEDDAHASRGNARLNAVHTREGANAAAHYLRKIAPSFRPAARSLLETAATHYDAIVALLEPSLAGKGPHAYEEFMGNAAGQEAHAANVLQPIKAELAAAAGEMEKALAAE